VSAIDEPLLQMHVSQFHMKYTGCVHLIVWPESPMLSNSCFYSKCIWPHNFACTLPQAA